MYVHSPSNVDKSAGSVVKIIEVPADLFSALGTLNLHICQPGLYKKQSSKTKTKANNNKTLHVCFLIFK